jgi:hypothetical protein
VKFKSPVYSQASGSIAGITYSHNRGGMYTRARAIPSDPGSPFQVAIRGYVAGLTSAWNEVLTAAQRAAWDLYAENVTLLNPLGEPINVGGLGHYVRSNVPRLNIAAPRVDAAPTTFNLGFYSDPSFGTFAAATNDFAVTFVTGDPWVDEDDSHLIVYSSRPQNPAVNYFKGPYRFADSIEGDSITPPTSPATVVGAFPFEVGQKVFVMARLSRADGRLSTPFRGSGVAA